MSSQPAIQRALHDAGEGRITNAVASMRLVLKLSPNDLEALSVMGMLLVQAGQPEPGQKKQRTSTSVEGSVKGK